MANAFSKEERVAFEQMLEGFNDALVLSKHVSVYNTDQGMMERTRNTIWRPQPYIATSITTTPGSSIAGQYKDFTQLAVPASINTSKTVPWTMNTLELRDALQEGRLGDAAKQRLASDINRALMDVAANQGTLVVSVSGAAGDYDDIAQCDSIFNEQGIAEDSRYLALSSRDYNGLAGNLAVATRSFGNRKSDDAYERNRVGMVAGFDTYKFDYANRIQAAAGGVTTINTTIAQAQYVPRATSNSVGGQINVDNRFQTVTVSNTVGVVAGDAFTIDGVFAVHHITKQSTGQLKTFRVISVTNGTDMVIAPAIVSARVSPTDAEVQYQNVVITAASATANINWLNTNATSINPFWHKDAIELLPGRYAVPSNGGPAIMRATTDQGVELVLQKFYDIDSMTVKYRMDTLFGVVNKQPQMSGILLFNQP
jgi:hypothetical protein